MAVKKKAGRKNIKKTGKHKKITGKTAKKHAAAKKRIRTKKIANKSTKITKGIRKVRKVRGLKATYHHHYWHKR